MAKTLQVRELGKEHNVGVAAKLRCAIKHASLPAHEQKAHAVSAQYRKDSANRARGQGILPSRDKTAIVFAIPSTVVEGLTGTIPAIPLLPHKLEDVVSCKFTLIISDYHPFVIINDNTSGRCFQTLILNHLRTSGQ